MEFLFVHSQLISSLPENGKYILGNGTDPTEIGD